MSFRVIDVRFTSRLPRIFELNGKTIFLKLSGADSCEAGELLPRSVDQVKIAIGTVVTSQPDIGARCLCALAVDLRLLIIRAARPPSVVPVNAVVNYCPYPPFEDWR